MNKKAQVTVFIIMGIVILFAVSIVLFIRSETSKVFVEKYFLPEEIIPIREYVQTCLEDVAREGINQIGFRGGYARYEDLPDEVKYNPKARLNIFPEAGAVLPLWYYREREYKPTLYEMQHMLAKFVEENIDSCLGDFEAFSNKFEIEKLSKPEVRRAQEHKVLKYLTDNDVFVDMIYRFKITSKADGEETKISLFNTKLPIRLKKLFEIAEQIYKAENEQLFLEDQLINLMSLSEEVIPLTYVEFGRCAPLVMTIKELKNNVKGLAQFNFPNTVINDTRTKELRPYEWYAELHQTYNLGIRDADDVAIEFEYQPDWPMDLMVYPNRGRYIRADPFRLFDIINTCFLQYHFVYDINFPIRINVVDSETKNHESFVFSFAMPVIINHNEGDKISNPRHIPQDIVIPSESDYCENYPKSEMTIRARNIVIYEDLVDINLTYRCTAFECDIGKIDFERGLTTQVPRCQQAVITARGEGYKEAEIFADSTKDPIVQIDMLPAKKIKFKVIKKRAHNPNVKFRMEEGETAIVTLTNYEYNHTSFGLYDPLQEDLAEIEILSKWDYEYNAEIMLIDNDLVTGGYNANWTLEWRDFVAADQIIFYVHENPDIETMPEDQAEEAQYELLANITEISKKIPEPEFE